MLIKPKQLPQDTYSLYIVHMQYRSHVMCARALECAYVCTAAVSLKFNNLLSSEVHAALAVKYVSYIKL